MEDHLLCPHGQKGLGLYFSERWTAGQFSSMSRSKWINESPLLKPCRVLERTARRAPSRTLELSPAVSLSHIRYSSEIPDGHV